jgi:signal transduction histidine kinase
MSQGGDPVKSARDAEGYGAGYLVGYLLIATAALRAILFYLGRASLLPAVVLFVAFTLLYTAEPLLSRRFRWTRYVYFPLQTALLYVLTNLQPFIDVTCQLYIALSVQAFHAFERRAAISWLLLFAALLTATEVRGRGLLDGLGLSLIIVGGGVFVVSYELLYARTRADQVRARGLLIELQGAHQELQAYAAQVEELAAVQERNRLARELHDSVGQTIFSVNLTSQAARLLLDRDSSRVPEHLDRLESMTGGALAQLRALIAQLHPPTSSSPISPDQIPPPAG